MSDDCLFPIFWTGRLYEPTDSISKHGGVTREEFYLASWSVGLVYKLFQATAHALIQPTCPVPLPRCQGSKGHLPLNYLGCGMIRR
jgi:hypothetical protein